MSTDHERQANFVVAAANFSPVYGDTSATVDKMLDVLREAASQGADLVVFPELALHGCGSCEACRAVDGPCAHHLELAETVPGPSTERLHAAAAALGLYVVVGMSERDPEVPTTLYNAAAVIGPEGILGTYRKVHLGALPWVTEGITYTPGTSLPVFATRFGPMGVQICYDFWFNPELTRLLALKGARTIAVPVGSFAAPDREQTMRATALARAQENLVHVVVSNSVGGPGARATGYAGRDLTESLRPDSYLGHSMITGPAFPRFGHLYAEAGGTEELVLAPLSNARLDRFATVFDYRSWRRTRLRSASRLIADEFAALAED
jgi:N-carbamoylputrescine amidase